MIKSLIATRSKGADEGRAHGVQELAGGLSGVLVHARSIGACADRPEAARRALSQRSQASARELIVGVSYRTSYVRFSNHELHLLLVPPQRGKGTYYPRQR
jgi:hypothetical protein